MDTEAQEAGLIIAEDNDAFRRSNPTEFTITVGIWENCNVSEVVSRVRSFNEFDEDNDPYGEHDFGSFVLDGRKLFWKIDYYDQNKTGYCDPLRIDCQRVLTVMLAEEY